MRAPLEPSAQGKIYFVDPTNHPGFEEDAGHGRGPQRAGGAVRERAIGELSGVQGDAAAW